MKYIILLLFGIILSSSVLSIDLQPSHFYKGSLNDSIGSLNWSNRNGSIISSVDGTSAFVFNQESQTGLYQNSGFSELNISSNWAYATCIKGTPFSGTDVSFASRLDSSNYFVLDITAGGTASRAGIRNSTAWVSGKTTGRLQNNTPYCFVVNNFAGNIHLYVNGTNQSGTDTPNTMNTNGATVGYIDPSSYWSNMSVYYIAIYNQTLNSSMIATLNNFSYNYSRGCVDLINGAMNNITENTLVCDGTYYPRDTQGYGGVVLWGDGTGKNFTCSSGTIIDMNRLGVGVGTYTNTDNWGIINCTIVNSSTGIRLASNSVNRQDNMTVRGNRILNSYDLAGIFISGSYNFIIENNEIAYGINFSSSYNDVVHGIYCSADTGVRNCEVGTIRGNYIHNNGGTLGGGSGIHVNNVVNKTHSYLNITNNTIANHYGKAVDMNSCEFCIYENNDFINSTTGAISIGAADGFTNASRNSIFRYNRINQSAVNDSIRVDIRLFYNLSNISIYGNNYTLNNSRIVYHTGYVSNVSVNETTNVSFTYNTGAGVTYATVDLYYPYSKQFTLYNNNFYLYGLVYPYDDIKNNSVIYVYDVNNASLNISNGDAWTVGDYGLGSICTYSGSGNFIIGNRSCNITTSYNLLLNNFLIYNSTVVINSSIYNYSLRNIYGGSYVLFKS